VECGLFAEIGSDRNARQLLDGCVSLESQNPERNQQDDDKTTNSELESLAAIFEQQADTSGKKRQKTDSRQTARQRGNSLSRAHDLASSSSRSRHRCTGHELPSQPVAVPERRPLAQPVTAGVGRFSPGVDGGSLILFRTSVSGVLEKTKNKKNLCWIRVFNFRISQTLLLPAGSRSQKVSDDPCSSAALPSGRDDWLKPVKSSRWQVTRQLAMKGTVITVVTQPKVSPTFCQGFRH
jgi:hypothetical protein